MKLQDVYIKIVETSVVDDITLISAEKDKDVPVKVIDIISNSGGTVLGHLDGTRNVNEIIEILLSIYDIERISLEEKLFNFLEELCDKKYIKYLKEKQDSKKIGSDIFVSKKEFEELSILSISLSEFGQTYYGAIASSCCTRSQRCG